MMADQKLTRITQLDLRIFQPQRVMELRLNGIGKTSVPIIKECYSLQRTVQDV